MIYSVDLDEMAGRISYVVLCKYVSDLQWKKYEGKVRPDIAVYQKFVGKDFYQLTIPCSRYLNDYTIAIRKAIQTLSFTEKKSEEQLILELLNPMSDILRVRHISNSVENGSILFEDAINLFENSKKLLLNATLDEVSYKLIHKGRPSENVQQFISQCRYGQTEIGSYVISLVCPFVTLRDDGKLQQLSIFSEEEISAYSITRRATKKVVESIATIKDAIDNGENLSNIVEDPQKHISVSFLESLANLNIMNVDSALEISAKWAPTIKENVPQRNVVSITHDYYSPIKSIVDKYKTEDEKKSVALEGRIFLLEASPRIEDRTKGKVKLVYINEKNQAQKLQLELEKEYYDVAINAHQEGKTVRAIGEISGKKMLGTTLEIL